MVRSRIAERLGRVLARIVLPVMERTKSGREFLAALNYYGDGGAAGVMQREMLTKFKNHPVYQRNWIVWKDEQTGELMRSCVDARDSNRVWVGRLNSIHDPGIMSAAHFETRYGASVRKRKKR